jgi:hypothetical protein
VGRRVVARVELAVKGRPEDWVFGRIEVFKFAVLCPDEKRADAGYDRDGGSLREDLGPERGGHALICMKEEQKCKPFRWRSVDAEQSSGFTPICKYTSNMEEGWNSIYLVSDNINLKFTAESLALEY